MASECFSDETLLRIVSGGAADSVSVGEQLQYHLDQCVDCRAVFAELNRGTGAEITEDRDFPCWVEKCGAEFVRPGAIIDRYEIQHKIGAGSMSFVFAARDNKLDRDVAIKFVRVMSEDREWASRLRDRLLEEARVLARLSHPNVVAVYDVSVLGQWVYLVMERVDGGTLSEWLETRTRSFRERNALFEQIANGLVAAHDAGIVHRDIKPSNILVDSNDRVHIADFGLARAFDAGVDGKGRSAGVEMVDSQTSTLEFTRELVGTPAYMAPEVADGARATVLSDQFAFWLCWVEAMTGERPRRSQQYRLPGELSKKRRRVARRGLAVSPNARFPSMKAAHRAFMMATRPGFSKIAAAVAIAVLIMLAIVGGRYWYHKHRVAQHCEQSASRVERTWTAVRNGAAASFAAEDWARLQQSYTRFADDWRLNHRGVCKMFKESSDNEVAQARFACSEFTFAGIEGMLSTLTGASTLEGLSFLDQAIRNLEDKPGGACLKISQSNAAHYVFPWGLRASLLAQRREIAARMIRHEVSPEPSALLDDSLAQARRTEYKPLIIGGLFLAADRIGWVKAETAVSLLTEAASTAGIIGDQERVALATISATLFGYPEFRPAAVDELMSVAEREVERAGASPKLRAMFNFVRAHVAAHRSDTAAAIGAAREAVTAAAQYGQDGLLHQFTLGTLAHFLATAGHLDEAKTIMRKACSLTKRFFGPNSLHTADCALVLANILALGGEKDEAVPLLDSAVETIRKRFSPGDKLLGDRLAQASSAYNYAKKHEVAASLARQVLDIARVYGDRVRVFAALQKVLSVEVHGYPDETIIALALEARDLAEEVSGKNSSSYHWVLKQLGYLYVSVGRYQEALFHFDTLRALLQNKQADHPYLPVAVGGQCNALYWLKKPKAAIRRCKEMLALLETRGVIASHPVWQEVHLNMTLCYLDLRRLRDAVRTFAKTGKPRGDFSYVFTSARLLWHQGRKAEARAKVRDQAHRVSHHKIYREILEHWLRAPY